MKIGFLGLGFLRLFTLKALLPSSTSSSLLLIVPFKRSGQPSAVEMKKTRKCKACDRPFAVDHRNTEQHAFCARTACQRRRRRQAQRQRRQRRRPATAGTQAIGAHSRLHSSVKPGEAAIPLQNPLFIGLISMLTGSTDLEEIQNVARRAYQQGCNILGLGMGSESTSCLESTA